MSKRAKYKPQVRVTKVWEVDCERADKAEAQLAEAKEDRERFRAVSEKLGIDFAELRSQLAASYRGRIASLEGRLEESSAKVASLQADKAAALLVIDYERAGLDYRTIDTHVPVKVKEYLDAKRRLGL